MPLSLRLLKTAINYKISPELIKTLHFYDLQDLILSFNVSAIKSYLEQEHKAKLENRGIDGVDHINGKNILNYL